MLISYDPDQLQPALTHSHPFRVLRSIATDALPNLLQAHAIRVISDGSGPVGENTQDSNPPGKHVESFVHIAVLLHCNALRIEVIVETSGRGAAAKVGSLERP